MESKKIISLETINVIAFLYLHRPNAIYIKINKWKNTLAGQIVNINCIIVIIYLYLYNLTSKPI